MEKSTLSNYSFDPLDEFYGTSFLFQCGEEMRIYGVKNGWERFKHEVNPQAQHVVVNGGLTDVLTNLVPSLASKRFSVSDLAKPILIDPFDYQNAKEMLLLARNRWRESWPCVVEYIDEAIERVDVVLSGDVRHVKLPLQEAIKDLEGIADTVIMAREYPGEYSMKYKLLKPEAIINYNMLSA